MQAGYAGTFDINRITVEFKDDYTDEQLKSYWNINRITVEFKGALKSSLLNASRYINRITVEFKGIPTISSAVIPK